jgi:hypothetical protein
MTAAWAPFLAGLLIGMLAGTVICLLMFTWLVKRGRRG